MKKRIPVKKLVLVFCAITMLIMGIIFAYSTGPKTWHAIREMQPAYLLLAFALGAALMSITAVILMILTNAAGKGIGFLYALETVLAYYFLSSISPTVSGGEPILIYMLHKKGLPIGKATSIALVRGALVLIVIAVVAPLVIYFHGEVIQNAYLKDFFYYVAGLILAAAVFLTYTFYRPGDLERGIRKIRMRLGRCRFLARHAETLEKALDRWIEDFGSCLKAFLKVKKRIIVAVVLLTMLSISANYLIAFAILKGLGFYLSPLEIVMIQFVLYFFLYFAPTPGGAGVAEGGGYLMFAAFVPTYLLGVFIILWRFFTAYLWMILGGVFITRSIGMNVIEKMPSET